MIKKHNFIAWVLIAVLMLTVVFLISGCNKQIIDPIYRFDYAMIRLPNGDIVEGHVENWMDFDDSDQIQVKINGVYYLVHMNNCILMAGYNK